MIKQEDVYRIGRLGKPHGVRGELSFQFEDDIFDRVDADYLILDIDGILVPFFIEEYRFRSNEICLLKLCDIDTEERACELTGCDVFFPRALAQEEDGGASWAEIIGFKVIDEATGNIVGTIQAVDDSTINVLFTIATPQGEVLLPASDDLICAFDRQAQTITMTIPDGLLSL